MFTLTETRFSKVRPILDRYRSELYAEGTQSHAAMDGELREALKVGPDSIRGLLQEVYVRYPRYKYVAAYSMQFGCEEAPANEHKPMLRELYKALREKSDDLAEIGTTFWERFKSKKAMALRKEIDEIRLSPDKAARLETIRAELRALTGELY
jgi:hypothetical protein